MLMAGMQPVELPIIVSLRSNTIKQRNLQNSNIENVLATEWRTSRSSKTSWESLSAWRSFQFHVIFITKFCSISDWLRKQWTAIEFHAIALLREYNIVVIVDLRFAVTKTHFVHAKAKSCIRPSLSINSVDLLHKPLSHCCVSNSQS